MTRVTHQFTQYLPLSGMRFTVEVGLNRQTVMSLQPDSKEVDDCIVEIAGRAIGDKQPPYIVAEMSGNHNGDISRAFRILDAAKAAGADAVKIQTYRADTITIDHHGPEFIESGGLWAGRRLYELYEEAHTPWEWHSEIFDHARKIGITIFSSPFDVTAVDFLESLDAPAYKIASPEIVDLQLIRKVAQTGKPIIISTGMATLEEIGEAVSTAQLAGAKHIIVLHCTAAYPTPVEEANLATMEEISRRFNVTVGLSDHTLGTAVSVIAVALGATFIEKHFTLDRAEGGVDSAFSLEPPELSELVKMAKDAHAAVGKPAFTPTASETLVLKNRRSLYIVAAVKKGQILDHTNVRSIRPGNGLKPKYLDQVVGQTASRDIAFGEPLDQTMVTGGLIL